MKMKMKIVEIMDGFFCRTTIYRLMMFVRNNEFCPESIYIHAAENLSYELFSMVTQFELQKTMKMAYDSYLNVSND